MNIKLNITLTECNGTINVNKLKDVIRRTLLDVSADIWADAGLTYCPLSIKAQLTDIENPQEDEDNE